MCLTFLLGAATRWGPRWRSRREPARLKRVRQAAARDAKLLLPVDLVRGRARRRRPQSRHRHGRGRGPARPRHRTADSERLLRPRDRRPGPCFGTGRWGCSRSAFARRDDGGRRRRSPRARHDGRRRRRLGGGAQRNSAWPTREPPLDGRRGLARVCRGPRAPRGGGAEHERSATGRGAVHRRQLEDVQDRRRGRGFIQSLPPRCARSTDRGRVLPPFPALAGWSTRPRLARQVCAQNVRRAPRGAFTGEVSAPMLAEVGVHACPRSFGAPPAASARPTGRSPEGARGARAGLLPILCVGETEAEREATTPSASSATRSRRLWATSPPTARRRRDRLRADLGDRHGHDRDARAGSGSVRLHPRARRRPRRASRPSARASSTAAA